MNISQFAFAAIPLALCAVTTLSSADETQAMNACVDAFVSANLPDEQPVKVTKIESVAGPLLGPSQEYSISLTAEGADSGKSIARATCFVQHDGKSIMLNGKRVPSGASAK